MDSWDYEPDDPSAYITINGPVEGRVRLSASPEPWELEPGTYRVDDVNPWTGTLGLIDEDTEEGVLVWVSEDVLDVTVCRDRCHARCDACRWPHPCEDKGWISNEQIAQHEADLRDEVIAHEYS